MNERTTLEIIAPTVEEALAQGLAQLGLTADAVSVEVLDAGTKGLFGMGGRQVRVRLTINPPGGAPAPESPQPKSPARAETPVERKTKPREAPRQKKEPAVPAEDAEGQLVDTTEAVISKLLHNLGLQAQVSAHVEESQPDDHRSVHVDIRGDDLSSLIGRHAETLNAFQYLAALIIGKEMQQWVQLVVDVEGYRSRREKQLRLLANRMAEQVIKTGRKATLEPMNPGERRIIHLELRGHPAVTTLSVGDEPHRKVTVIPKES